MAEEWHYAGNGERAGPISKAEILDRILRAPDEPHYVWTPGMSEWIDARRSPQFSLPAQLRQAPVTARQARPAPTQRALELARRARHELISYLAISGYLMAWFAAVLFYKSTILRGVGVEFAPFGLAAVKALILGKFMLVLEAFKIGEMKTENRLLIVGILQRALLFTLVLFALSVSEDLIVGHFHGREVKEVLHEVGGGSIAQAAATAVLMFLVLLPYLAFRRLAQVFGELPELLFTLHPPPKLSRQADENL